MTFTESEYWNLIHAERARVANMLEGLSENDWRVKSLSSDWTVEQVVAHLIAAANTGMLAWLRSMVFAGFNPSRHNERRLAEHLGDTPAETLRMFRESINNTVAPTKDYAAWLGEVIVHGQDIAHPLGIELSPEPVAVTEVAKFFASKDFAVKSQKLVKDLRLEADDAAFQIGSGPMVRGNLLDLVMVMAGRSDYILELEGDGVEQLRHRLD